MSNGGRDGSSIGLAARIRLIVLTTPSPACGSSLPSVVLECLEAGCRAVQLRDKNASGLELYEQAVAYYDEVLALRRRKLDSN